MISAFILENLPCRVMFSSGTVSVAKAEVERLGGKRALVQRSAIRNLITHAWSGQRPATKVA